MQLDKIERVAKKSLVLKVRSSSIELLYWESKADGYLESKSPTIGCSMIPALVRILEKTNLRQILESSTHFGIEYTSTADLTSGISDQEHNQYPENIPHDIWPKFN